jgi:hypothetical protein
VLSKGSRSRWRCSARIVGGRPAWTVDRRRWALFAQMAVRDLFRTYEGCPAAHLRRELRCAPLAHQLPKQTQLSHTRTDPDLTKTAVGARESVQVPEVPRYKEVFDTWRLRSPSSCGARLAGSSRPTGLGAQ